METEGVEIICNGYVEEELTNFDQIEEVMAEIEQGTILRPEFELVFPTEKPTVCAAVCFREAEDGFVEGWFVWHILEESKNTAVYCLKSCKIGQAGSKHVMCCGCPEVIDSSAILSRGDALRILESLVNGEPIRDFEQRSYAAVFGWDQE
jgi:hypothetical protein